MKKVRLAAALLSSRLQHDIPISRVRVRYVGQGTRPCREKGNMKRPLFQVLDIATSNLDFNLEVPNCIIDPTAGSSKRACT